MKTELTRFHLDCRSRESSFSGCWLRLRRAKRYPAFEILRIRQTNVALERIKNAASESEPKGAGHEWRSVG